MDKSKWDYKPFEDCIEKSKKTKQLMTSDYQPEGSYPIISQESSLISGYTDNADYVNHFDRPIVVFGDHTRVLKYVDFDFAVGADGVKILIPNTNLNAKFLLDYLTWYKIPNLGYSRHYKLLKDISLPVPPIEDQQRIVAELDCLNELIAVKQEQLKEFDKLASSIFYDMFGDPVMNEKGWDIKKIKDVSDNCDYMRKPITSHNRIPGEIPYYGASGVVDYVRDYIFDGNYLLISEDGANLLARSTPIAFRIQGKTWVNNHAHVLKFKNRCEELYVEYSMNLRDISGVVTGCAQPKLTQANLNNITLNIPPLPLQQQFADKISAIEAQKELVKQSIAETQKLLDYTMDKYFG